MMVIEVMQTISLKPLTRPLPNGPKVSARMHPIAINIVVANALEEPSRNGRRIGIAHDYLPEMVNTMLMVLLAVDNCLWIVVWVEVLADMIEAVKCVEDVQSNCVAASILLCVPEFWVFVTPRCFCLFLRESKVTI